MITFFAYGSLQPGAWNFDRCGGWEVFEDLGPAEAPGRLYRAYDATDAYPVCRFGAYGSETVRGRLLALDDLHVWRKILVMEIESGYEQITFYGDVLAFHWRDEVDEKLRIWSGDWLKEVR
jgi:gamma-glutamylcyclotransferase (GGCT)/AIG2-like uncharacterized protein YtfP